MSTKELAPHPPRPDATAHFRGRFACFRLHASSVEEALKGDILKGDI